MIERYKVPLDEYPKRCVEQLANWHKELEEYKKASRIDIKPSREYASTIMNANLDWRAECYLRQRP
ncbi:alpha-galactosidase [Escherichia coli]|uniref:Alpha-galactosidase n=1 Tax=Escherichia coli TaxID=562 RepID=A0A2X1Q463_ECOLX|nr:alpha-galactosidase [Escherichia coli]